MTEPIKLPSSDEAAAHMLPSDLKKFEFGEHVAEAFSIAVGNPDETSQPLFTLEQVRVAIEADRQARGEPVSKPYPVKLHAWGGASGYHDYEMSDGSIQTLKGAEAQILFRGMHSAEPVAWRGMKTAPKDGTAVLVLLPGSDIPQAVRWKNDCWRMTWDGHQLSEYDRPRYWMPCPSDPDSSPQPQQHPDDAAVDAFANAMKAKLAKKRAEGRGGWQACDAAYLSELLRGHVEKGDPVDVANLSMMLHQNGQRIEPASVPSDAEADIVNLLSEYACHNTEHGRMSFDKWTLREAVSALLAKHPTPQPQQQTMGEPVATVSRKGNLIGNLVWTDTGRSADLPDGTMLYTAPEPKGK